LFLLYLLFGPGLMMQIREATNSDIPMIVSLLKLSLGEGLMPKSEQYWYWKHVENPYGQSPVLLCVEDTELIGVRAFMRWDWTLNGKVYKAVRAVDTATHPNHKGKGIFTKLTMRLVDHCKQMGDHFIFNTPNEQSKPGYLKMGWQEVGKLPIKVNIQRPLNIARNLLFNNDESKHGPESKGLAYFLEHPTIGSLLKGHLDKYESIGTALSASYLKWRYIDVPVASYVAVGEEQGGSLNGLVIGRIKQTRIGKEFRITELLLNDNADTKNLNAKVDEFRRINKIDYTTISGAKGNTTAFGRGLTALVGPIVTVRSLSLSDLHPFQRFTNWSPSIGDLELF
jgi:N-acetylglutamate synthase-like GNAT family acetyltransferase